MNILRTSPAALLLGITLVASACDRTGEQGGLAADRLTAATEPVVHAELLIRPGGQYFLNGTDRALSEGDLAPQLGRVAAPASGQKSIRILAEPGVVGYDVVVAMNAARETGFRRAIGIAEYVHNGANDKRWEQTLEPVPATGGGSAEAPLPDRGH